MQLEMSVVGQKGHRHFSIVSCYQQISFELYSITLTSAFMDMFAIGDDGTVHKVGRWFFYRVLG